MFDRSLPVAREQLASLNATSLAVLWLLVPSQMRFAATGRLQFESALPDLTGGVLELTRERVRIVISGGRSARRASGSVESVSGSSGLGWKPYAELRARSPFAAELAARLGDSELMELLRRRDPRPEAGAGLPPRLTPEQRVVLALHEQFRTPVPQGARLLVPVAAVDLRPDGSGTAVVGAAAFDTVSRRGGGVSV